jgi:hypothetical protein
MSKTIENVLTSSGFCWQTASAARMTFDIENDKKEYRKKYYIKNIEKFRNYYDDNKDSIAEYEKLYYQQNRTAIRDKQRVYFEKYYYSNKKQINHNSLQRYYNIRNMYYNTNLNNELLKQNIIISLQD